MKTWNFREAKTDFDRGLMKGAAVEVLDVLNSRTFVVHLLSILLIEGDGILVESRNREVRHFKSFDAAYLCLKRIGFQIIRLECKGTGMLK